VDLLAGLADEVRSAIGAVPETERVLLELRFAWRGLADREALVAARLRVFLLTWDPFGWMADRGAAWATATGDGDSSEVVLYVMLEDKLREARDAGKTFADVIGGLAGSVLAVGAAHEALFVSGAYPELADWPNSGQAIFAVMLGGINSFLGPVLGAMILLALNDVVTRITEYQGLVLGIVILAFALGLRRGVLDFLRLAWPGRLR